MVLKTLYQTKILSPYQHVRFSVKFVGVISLCRICIQNSAVVSLMPMSVLQCEYKWHVASVIIIVRTFNMYMVLYM